MDVLPRGRIDGCGDNDGSSWQQVKGSRRWDPHRNLFGVCIGLERKEKPHSSRRSKKMHVSTSLVVSIS